MYATINTIRIEIFTYFQGNIHISASRPLKALKTCTTIKIYTQLYKTTNNHPKLPSITLITYKLLRIFSIFDLMLPFTPSRTFNQFSIVIILQTEASDGVVVIQVGVS